MTDSPESIRVERHGVAALVVMNRPEVRNAIGPDEAQALAEALAQAAADPEVKGVVLTGEGAFSGGGDVKGMAARAGMPAEARRRLVYSRFQGVIRTLLTLPVPTCAALDGVAVGLGLDMAMACDSRFVGPGAWCRQGWGRLGLVSGVGGVHLLRHRAPGVLWRLLEEDCTLDAAAMVAAGLGEASGAGSARERALRRIALYAHQPRATLAAYAALDRAGLLAGLDAHLEAVLDRQIPLLTSPAFDARLRELGDG